jgi:hypothetical protein
MSIWCLLTEGCVPVFVSVGPETKRRGDFFFSACQKVNEEALLIFLF